MIPQPGQVVRVRSRQYLVENVLHPPENYQQIIVEMSCLDDDAQGNKLAALWQTELDAEVVQPSSWEMVAQKGFDSPRRFAAYLNVQRWNLVTSTNPKLFQAPYRAGIQVMTYQLEPLRKALAMPRVNLFIADDVGLGKSIEAGLILREMLIRQKIRRIIVACPPSVVYQWRDELEQRFGLTFVIFDRQYVQARREERGYGANPWKSHTRFIISHALLRDEEYAAPLRDWLGSYAPGSMLILDEAHNAAPATGFKYAIDSKLTRAVREIARRFEHRLFLSATPHNGHSNSFSALLEILDPQRFVRGIPIKAKQHDAVIIRRLKSDLRDLGVGGFPQREIIKETIAGLPPDAPELKLMELLEAYRILRESRLKNASKSARNTAKLVIISLQKRLFSSIEAFACSLRAHCRGLEKKATPLPKAASPKPSVLAASMSQLLLISPPDANHDLANLAEEEQRQDDEAEMLQASANPDEIAPVSPEERSLLEQMTAIAEASRALPDPRVHRLLTWIREHMCPGIFLPGEKASISSSPKAQWNNCRLLIFTEWIDTKRYLQERLREAIAETDQAEERLAVFHGGMGDETREEIKRAFNVSPAEHPLRILIATDAAREGINLQNYCSDLFHFDLPWNPSRLEQRNGRIDRKLQRAEQVSCHYFVFSQRPEDKVLETLVKKTERVQEELGSLSQVLENQIAQRIEEDGIRRAKVDSLAEAIEKEILAPEKLKTVKEELENDERKKKLSAEIEYLSTLMAQSQNYLGFDEEAFRDSLCCSLELLGADPLKHCPPENQHSPLECWSFPALDERIGADPTWAPTLDTLRAPRKKQQKLWDWRKESPVRKVVFKDTGSLDSDTVHLHLEHRLVQRLFGRFLAQGFVHDDLTRANIVLSEEAIRRVVLLGRLSLFGEGASRLHDEIIPITARWTESHFRKETLSPYAREAEKNTLELLYRSLRNRDLHHVPDETKQLLQKHVTKDVQELLPHLQHRAQETMNRAKELLHQRGEKEAHELLSLLENQQHDIERHQQEIAKQNNDLPGQLALPWKLPPDEERQLKADQKYWVERLKHIQEEKHIEPERIKQSYQVKVWRVEPVGVVYLWPRSG